MDVLINPPLYIGQVLGFCLLGVHARGIVKVNNPYFMKKMGKTKDTESNWGKPWAWLIIGFFLLIPFLLFDKEIAENPVIYFAVLGGLIVIAMIPGFLGEDIPEGLSKVKRAVRQKKINKGGNYLIAYNEVKENNIQSEELWAEAFALSDGDKDRQQAIYVKLRAKQLKEGRV